MQNSAAPAPHREDRELAWLEWSGVMVYAPKDKRNDLQ
jgi:hypothetical protein